MYAKTDASDATFSQSPSHAPGPSSSSVLKEALYVASITISSSSAAADRRGGRAGGEEREGGGRGAFGVKNPSDEPHSLIFLVRTTRVGLKES